MPRYDQDIKLRRYRFYDLELKEHIIEGRDKYDAVMRYCDSNETESEFILKNYKIVRVYPHEEEK